MTDHHPNDAALAHITDAAGLVADAAVLAELTPALTAHYALSAATAARGLRDMLRILKNDQARRTP